ncbi:MAG TPA: hypothetical protein VFT02_04835, partial [Pyrinomonadaceae bacterium]|nr:hypothetical protein [Pyrinomonadaceae bacterium]
SELVPELDPLVDRVILRCLQRDPGQRPPTALQVAAALPGGDPLAAALAAGETPSPEMVAAAPKQGALKPAIAVSLLASVVVLLAFVCFLSRNAMLYRQVPLEKSPEVLRDRASELVKKFGYVDPPGDSAYGMADDRRYLEYIHDHDPSPARWQRLRAGQPAAIYFWHRQSPWPFDVSNGGFVNENIPARSLPGMTTMTLDTLGRLRSFYAVPAQRSSATDTATTPDWSVLLRESGLDQAQLQPVTPLWTPPHESTTRAAWAGSYPHQPDIKFHVEAAAFEGKPVYFEIFHAWNQPAEQGVALSRFRGRVLFVLLLGIFIIVMLASALLALRNLKLGRGDRKGAFRLAAFVFAVTSLRWIFTAHHVAAEGEALNFISGVQNILFWTFFYWVVYLAFEPFVRRRWPGRIIAWSRVLTGGFRDPLVGRDILIGAVFGLGIIVCYFYLPRLGQEWAGQAPDIPWLDYPATQLLGIRSFAFGFTNQITAALLQGFILLFVLLLMYIIVRRERLAALAVWLIGAVTLSLTLDSAIGIPFAALSAGLAVLSLYRFGLLTTIVALFFLHLLIFQPITSDFTAWYAGDFVLAAIISLALAIFGFYTSLAGEPLFRGARLDD